MTRLGIQQWLLREKKFLQMPSPIHRRLRCAGKTPQKFPAKGPRVKSCSRRVSNHRIMASRGLGIGSRVEVASSRDTNTKSGPS